MATTRFVTPDGKLFRLVSSVTVPGAQVTNGQIVPSSIDAPVAADQPGDAYNVGPVNKLTIPGFQGSPKYNAFYGQLASGTSGGFVGTKAVPTAADITSGKDKSERGVAGKPCERSYHELSEQFQNFGRRDERNGYEAHREHFHGRERQLQRLRRSDAPGDRF